MDVFVQVAELRSFSAAGRKLRLSPSAVSKLVTRLEDRLGTRLLVRTTRSLQLTPEGEVYLERAQRILADIEETERMVTAGGATVPRGPLRVSASVAIGVRCIVPLIPDFLALYPEIELDISLSDSIIDIVGERADVAIRVGPLRDSSLKARKLLERRRVIVASPAYIARHGLPATPDDLNQHNCLTFNFRPGAEGWPFRDPTTGS
jgi:DNA-binding transcriptional LysR family regulator